MIVDNMMFVEIWTESASLEEACQRLGSPVRTALEHARYLREEGVVLQEFLTGPKLFTN